MEFDSITHQPTYKLTLGTPSGSKAIEIFKILARDFSDSTSLTSKAELINISLRPVP